MQHATTVRRFAIAAALVTTLAAAAVAQAGPTLSGLVLSEIMAGPASDWNQSGDFSSRDDEWVEVVNAGDIHVDLGEYFLTDDDSIPRFAFSGSLAAQERAVVFGSDAHAWERDHGFPAFGLSLANGGDRVLLWRVVAGDTTLVDAYAYRSHEAAADRSIGRANDEEGWILFDGLNPYTGTLAPQGNGCNPSPGSANLCQVTEAKTSSWGAIKSLYR